MSLRVGFLCAGWPPDVGGVETHARDLARELLRRGHAVDVLCLDRSGAGAPYTTRDELAGGARVRRMAYAYADHAGLADLVRNRRSEVALDVWLAERRPEVLHVHHLDGFGAGALERARAAGVGVVATLHDYWLACPRGQMVRPDGVVSRAVEARTCAACLGATWPALLPSGGGARRGPAGEALEDDEAAAAARTAFALGALEHAARVLVPSAAAREVLAAAGVERGRLEVCEHGLDPAPLRAAVERARAAGARRGPGVRLGVLGAVQPGKGVLELALALRDADAPDLVLEVHGPLLADHGDPAHADAVRAAAAADARVELRGPYAPEDLASVLAGLDGVAAPSRWVEVFGLAAREARAAGLPVLVSAVGGLAELAADGAAGLALDPEDRAAWTRALERFARDAGARARWASAPFEPRSLGDLADQVEAAYRAARAPEPRP